MCIRDRGLGQRPKRPSYPYHCKKEVSLLIEFKHVSKTYPNGVKGLKDVNLKFEPVSYTHLDVYKRQN